MSIRTSFATLHRPIHTAFRAISTTRVIHNPETTSSSGSSSNSGFASLLDSIFNEDVPKPATPQLKLPTPDAPNPRAVIRGYHHRDIPPLIDPVIDLFTNMMMRHGNKEEAQKWMSLILEALREVSNSPPIPMIHQAVQLGSPTIRILNLRKSMKTIPTPRVMDDRQRTRQSIAWILKAAEKGRGGVIPRWQRVTREVLAVLEGQSPVFTWLDERHKAAMLARSNIKAR